MFNDLNALSNDMGALAGLLFDIGSGRYAAPPRDDDAAAVQGWEADLEKVREESAAAHKRWAAERESDATHTEIQGWLRDLGKSLGYGVWIASNDQGRSYRGGRLGDGCLTQLPAQARAGLDSVRLIDVIWVEADGSKIAAAFEVEHSTSIYSGIVRMLDLALGTELGAGVSMFLVAPDARREDVRSQLRRPAFTRVAELGIRYLPYSELGAHRDAIGRFGSGLKPLNEISHLL